MPKGKAEDPPPFHDKEEAHDLIRDSPPTYEPDNAVDLDEVKDIKCREDEGQIKEEKKTKENANGKEEKSIAPPGRVAFSQLFRFATTSEIVLLIIGIISSLITGAFLPIFSLLFGELLEEINNPDLSLASKGLEGLAFQFLVMSVVMGVAGLLRVGFLKYVAAQQGFRIREFFLRSTLRQDIEWFDLQKSSSVTVQIAADTALVELGLGQKLGEALEYTSTGFSGIIVGFYISWELTLVILAIGPIMGILGACFGKFMGEAAGEENARYAAAGSIVEETISSMRTVVAFNGQAKEATRYGEQLKQARLQGIKSGNALGCFMGGFNFVMYACYGLCFWYGGSLITSARSNISGGDVLAVFFCVLFGAMMLGLSGPSVSAIMNAQVAAYSLFQIIDRVPPIDIYSEKGIRLDVDPGSILEHGIEFCDVHFTYPSRPDEPILKGISFHVKKGKSLALVGSSGSGKSTCVALIQRFYDIADGSIMINGHDIKTINVRSLRSMIGLVSQEPLLFNTTIAENIGYGKDGATEDMIIRAARGANIASFIESQPNRYDTLVGENGTQLSGGQKQRIAIARALVRDPPVLLLDEATSALDTESERIVQEALDKLMEGRTTIAIAHRLSTIRDADCILVFQKGNIVEKGNHVELMESSNGESIYRGLVEKQEINKDVGDDDLEGVGETDLVRAKSSERKSVSEIRRKSIKEVQKVSTIRLIKMIRPEWIFLVIGLIFAMVQGIVMPAFTILLTDFFTVFYLCEPFMTPNGTSYGGRFTDLTECHNKMEEDIGVYAIYFLILGAGMGLSFWLTSISFAIIGERLTKRLRYLSFKGILRQEISYFDKDENSTGFLSSKLSTDAAVVKAIVTTGLSVYAQNIVTLVLCLGIAFSEGWEMTLALMVAAPFLGIGSVIEQNFFIESQMGDKETYDQAGKIVFESVKGIRTVAAFSIEERMVMMYKSILAPVVSKIRKESCYAGLAFGYSKFIQFFFYFIAFYFASFLIKDDSYSANGKPYTADQVMKVIFAILMGAMGMGQAAAYAGDLGKAKIAVPMVFTLIDMIPKTIDIGTILDQKDIIEKRYSNVSDVSDKVGGKILNKVEGTIILKDVYFRYPSRPTIKILRGVSLTILPGQTVALVGQSGSGKSTIVSLVERFYDPVSGSITLDGINLQDINLISLRNNLGLVGQEPVLFSTTIAENIRYAKDNATMEEIKAAARSANIADFIEGLKSGYDTEVGSMGNQLSGGQKQRVAIARAIIRNPRILLLDEATAALDSESEQLVQSALDNLMGDRTTLVIAHRLSTIQNAHKIIVMEAGKIREVGTHQELLQKKGIYKNLCEQQQV